MLRTCIACMGVSLLAMMPAWASTILYDNGAIVGTQGSGAPQIQSGFVSDSFILSSSSIISGTANVGLWVGHGDAPSSVDWVISTSPFTGVLASGTAAWSSSFLFTNAFNFDIYSGSFSLPNVSLVAGTYWLELGNATTAPSSTTFWDRSATGTSQAFDGNTSSPDIASNSFQIIGNVNAGGAPEPATLGMIGAGLLGLMLIARRRAALKN